MANSIILKRTATSGRVFTTEELALGEIGINTYDGKLYIRKNDGADAIVQVGEMPPNYTLDNLTDVITTDDHVPVNGYALVYNSALSQWIPSKISTPGLTLVSSDVTGALGFTPLQASSLSVSTAAASGSGSLSYSNGVFTFAPPNLSSYLTGITSSQVTTALGFTPISASSLSVTTAAASGSGSLDYTNGVFTFTPPKLTNFLTLSALSGGTGVTYSNVTGVIAIGQAVATTSNVTFNDLTVSGNLTVNGTTTTVNSTTVTVDDKNLELGSVASPTNTTADGGGITLKGATDKTLNWINSTSSWTSSENFDLASGKTYKIGGVDVVTSTGAASAAKLTTARNISGVAFDGTADITINLSSLGDTLVTSPTNGQTLQYNGTKWVNTSGAVGYTGSRGVDGVIGYNGSAGFVGSAGSTGFVGSRGADGVIGYNGSTGYVGSTGFVGSRGADGATGLGFSIAKTYSSVAALTADTSPTGIVAGQFALIDTGNVENAENSRLYLWNGSVYSYVTDLSGAQGITGPVGSAGAPGYVGSAGYSGSKGAGVYTYSSTPPSNPLVGDRWLDSNRMSEVVWTNDGDSTQWVEVAASGFLGQTGYTGSVGYVGSAGTGQMTWQVVSSSITVVANNGYFVDTTGSAITLTLPATASIGQTIRFNDLAGNFAVNNLTIARNGYKIQGVADDLVVSDTQASFGLVYSNAAYGWKIMEV